MTDPNCIFCKIAAGEIPSTTIYEDALFRVILDINPASKGHTLVIPKAHARNLYELEDELLAKAVILAKKIANKMQEILKFDGFHLLQNNEVAAGQSVFHFHLHIIPRYQGDDLHINWPLGKLTDDVKEALLVGFAME